MSSKLPLPKPKWLRHPRDPRVPEAFLARVGARHRGAITEAMGPNQCTGEATSAWSDRRSSPGRAAREEHLHRHLREQAVHAADNSPVQHWNRPPPSRELASTRRERSRPRTATALNPAGFAARRSTGPSVQQSRETVGGQIQRGPLPSAAAPPYAAPSDCLHTHTRARPEHRLQQVVLVGSSGGALLELTPHI